MLDLTDRAKATTWIDTSSTNGSAIDVLVIDASGFAHAVPRPLEDVTNSGMGSVMAINPGIALAEPRRRARHEARAQRPYRQHELGAGIPASRTKLRPYTAAKHAVVG